MTYQPPSFLFWVLLVISICVAIYLTYRDISNNEKYNLVAWRAYDRLSELFRKLTHTIDEKERDDIHADIEKERGKVPDRTLDKMIRLFLNAEAERFKFHLNFYSDDAQYMLSLNNERMRNHIKDKYGERKPERENNLQTL
jgi:hypothetical protein